MSAPAQFVGPLGVAVAAFVVDTTKFFIPMSVLVLLVAGVRPRRRLVNGQFPLPAPLPSRLGKSA